MKVVEPLAAAADLLSAIADLIWPLLVVALLVVAYRSRRSIGPALEQILRTRDVSAELPGGLKLNVGGQPLEAQQVVDDQRSQTEQLRRDVSALAARVAELSGGLDRDEAGPATGPTGIRNGDVAMRALTRRVLWVDDQPANHAYEMAALKDREVDVRLATSTGEALAILDADPAFDALVTDLGHEEPAGEGPTIGLSLLRKLGERRLDIPTVVYASPDGVRRHGSEAIKLGAVGATADPTELLELLAINYGPRFALRFERQVRHVIERAGWTLVEQPANARLDFIAERGDERIGVEAKAWLGKPRPQRLERELERIAAADVEHRVLIVMPGDPAALEGVRRPPNVELVAFEQLEARLRPAAVAAVEGS